MSAPAALMPPDGASGATTGATQAVSAHGLLDDLTPPQRAAVTTLSGPLLVVAAAGSGKTRVLTRRIAFLIEQGVLPGSIVAITFTNKAAAEMRHRVSELLERMGRPPLRDFGRLDPRYPTVCTFHSLCLRILREYGPRLGIEKLSIFDTADQLRVVKEAMKAVELATDHFQPQQVLGAISRAKNQLLTHEAFAQRAADFFSRHVARVYPVYQRMLAEQNALDFDDLLMHVVLGLRRHPDVLTELHDRIDYLLIDEYQDTNHAQYMLAHLLAMKRRNICVVGDPDQSIYAWRGADLRNILEFKNDYPDAAEIKLETNYRSTPTILAVADELIRHNRQRIDKRLVTGNPDGEKVKLVLCQDEHDEAQVVVEAFKAAHAAGTPWGDMAVFYRMNSLSRVVEDALRRAGIPYVMARGVEFYNRREIKDVLAYLRAIVNPRDDVSAERVLATPSRGIGDASVQKLRVWASQKRLGLLEAAGRAGEIDGLPTRARNSLLQLAAKLETWRALAGVAANPPAGVAAATSPTGRTNAAATGPSRPVTNPPSLEDIFAAFEAPAEDERGDGPGSDAEAAPTPPRATRTGITAQLIERVLTESGLEAVYRKESQSAGDTGNDPLANVGELISAAAEFDQENPEGTLDDFLAQIALVSDTDALQSPEGGGAVSLMTLHAAKGLEFPVVAMIGWEHGILPHSRARDNEAELEEERRLAFVGITRAMRKLILTRAAARTVRGLREKTIASPFLRELPGQHIDVLDLTNAPTVGLPVDRRYRPDDDQLAPGLAAGAWVKHPHFGLGRVLEVAGTPPHTRCVVDFTQHGRKTLILGYARLEVVRPGT
ncbi:MAG: ATP-dependent helicase [Tepidisphaerales bacterium]